jgi:hypothetical protein
VGRQLIFVWGRKTPPARGPAADDCLTVVAVHVDFEAKATLNEAGFFPFHVSIPPTGFVMFRGTNMSAPSRLQVVCQTAWHKQSASFDCLAAKLMR